MASFSSPNSSLSQETSRNEFLVVSSSHENLEPLVKSSGGQGTKQPTTLTIHNAVHPDRSEALDPDHYIYIFNAPSHLAHLLTISESLNPLLKIRHIRLGIFWPIFNLPLTKTELNGGIDGPDTPNVRPLVEAWRHAFQNLPDSHLLRSIDFDMQFPGNEEGIRHIGKLLQHISTLVWLKRRDLVRFHASGCSAKKQDFLAKNFPNKDMEVEVSYEHTQ